MVITKNKTNITQREIRKWKIKPMLSGKPKWFWAEQKSTVTSLTLTSLHHFPLLFCVLRSVILNSIFCIRFYIPSVWNHILTNICNNTDNCDNSSFIKVYILMRDLQYENLFQYLNRSINIWNYLTNYYMSVCHYYKSRYLMKISKKEVS